MVEILACEIERRDGGGGRERMSEGGEKKEQQAVGKVGEEED